METADLSQLLTLHRSRLVGYFERKGRSIRQHESPEDLAQGVALHALANEGYFHYQGERQFVAWMLKVARQHLARRLEHWGAAKRDAGPMMRITFGVETHDGGSRGAVRMPAAEGPGPATHAGNLEELAIAARAMFTSRYVVSASFTNSADSALPMSHTVFSLSRSGRMSNSKTFS